MQSSTIESSGKSLRETANGLGISISTLSGWIKEYQEQGEDAFPGSESVHFFV